MFDQDTRVQGNQKVIPKGSPSVTLSTLLLLYLPIAVYGQERCSGTHLWVWQAGVLTYLEVVGSTIHCFFNYTVPTCIPNIGLWIT